MNVVTTSMTMAPEERKTARSANALVRKKATMTESVASLEMKMAGVTENVTRAERKNVEIGRRRTVRNEATVGRDRRMNARKNAVIAAKMRIVIVRHGSALTRKTWARTTEKNDLLRQSQHRMSKNQKTPLKDLQKAKQMGVQRVEMELQESITNLKATEIGKEKRKTENVLAHVIASQNRHHAEKRMNAVTEKRIATEIAIEKERSLAKVTVIKEITEIGTKSAEIGTEMSAEIARKKIVATVIRMIAEIVKEIGDPLEKSLIIMVHLVEKFLINFLAMGL